MNIDLEQAHDRSFRNRPTIQASAVCGCYYCRKTCVPSDIREYVRTDETALCPHCGIDSLIGDASGLPVTDASFLEAMHRRWFVEGSHRIRLVK